MDYTERLRRLTINDVRTAEEAWSPSGCDSLDLDAKTVALVRLGAMVGVHGGVSSFAAQADAAIAAGASVPEIVDVLVAVVPVVGLPSVVDAAPRLALALGYDAEEER